VILKVYLDSVGCRLNQSEIEAYARQFHAAGHVLAPTPQEADLVVVNTCAVTEAADSDSRQKVRQAARSGAQKIVVTGCWSTLNPGQAAALQGVSQVVPNAVKDRLVPDLLQASVELFDMEPLRRMPVPGARQRTRAFIKVQDGCNNHCTFCITTIARGAARSRTIPEILTDVRGVLNSSQGQSSPDSPLVSISASGQLSPGAAQEIVLTGVHLGSWGRDLQPRRNIFHLVQAILQQTEAPRLRLSSLEPWDLEAEFFSLWADPRLCRHLHLPLQSGCATTLQRMRRKTTPYDFARLVETARRLIPGVAITTDLIAGFPGEDEAEFAESLAFVQAMQFAGGHVFTYSARPGTAAARMATQVPHLERKERGARLRAALAESAGAYRARFLGQELPVLWESVTGLGPQGWQLSGLTDNYLRVSAWSRQPIINQITPVHLSQASGDTIIGKIQFL
jgi:threonylcarbamoyladenosine tRNA methylthiotransferase MtaB